MKYLMSKHRYGSKIIFLFIFGLSFISSGLISNAGAQEKKPVHITADKLITHSEAQYAEFIGNVTAVQQTTTTICDNLKIYYENSGGSTESVGDTQNAVKKIIAEGNVHIDSETRSAVAEKAVYTMDTGKVVLTGENARVTEGSNSVSGCTITMFRDEDRMVVESCENKPVEATIFTGETNMFE